MAKRKPSNSTIKTLNKKQDKLISEINKLGSQIHKIEGALKPLENDEVPSLTPSEETSNALPPSITPPPEERRTPRPRPRPRPLPPIPKPKESMPPSREIPPTPESIPSDATKIVEEAMIKVDLPVLPTQPRPKLELEEDVLKKIATQKIRNL